MNENWLTTKKKNEDEQSDNYQVKRPCKLSKELEIHPQGWSLREGKDRGTVCVLGKPKESAAYWGQRN